MDRTQDGRPRKMLRVVKEYTRECLAIAVRRRRRSEDIQEVLAELFLFRGCPTHTRSDHGPACMARICQHDEPASAVSIMSMEVTGPPTAVMTHAGGVLV